MLDASLVYIHTHTSCLVLFTQALSLLLCVFPTNISPLLNQLISVNDQLTSYQSEQQLWYETSMMIPTSILQDSCTLYCFCHVQLICWHFSAISLALSLSLFPFLLYIWNQIQHTFASAIICSSLFFLIDPSLFLTIIFIPSLLCFLFVIICCIGLKLSLDFLLLAESVLKCAILYCQPFTLLLRCLEAIYWFIKVVSENKFSSI